MARTKASVGAKISSGKSSKARCSVAPTTSTGGSSGSSDKSSRSSGGGNPVCPRETPKWQKPITNFFVNKHNESQESDGDGEVAGSSKPKPKRNIIQSDDETSPEKPKNHVLDETIELEKLTGDNSHKIEEYYPKGAKGKGKGKKTKETKDADSGNATEMEGVENAGKETDDIVENDGKVTEDALVNVGKETEDSQENCVKKKVDTKNNSENIDKENRDVNVESKERDVKIASEKDSSIKSRSKREREDKLEEDGNISKKIKVM